MNFRLILPIWYILFSFLQGNVIADEILTKISNHLNGRNRSMIIDSKIVKKGEIKKTQEIKVNLFWPENEEVKKITFIAFLKPKQKLGVKFWELHKQGEVNKRWVTMPVTGKLKDITHKKIRKNDFDFSELQLTKESISNHENTIVDETELIIIQSISNITQERKLLYIDNEFNFIQKVETFNKKNKLTKTIECIEFQIIDNVKIASKVIMEDYRRKHTVNIIIHDFKFHNFLDISIFQPKGN
jgi:hypothetical protein